MKLQVVQNDLEKVLLRGGLITEEDLKPLAEEGLREEDYRARRGHPQVDADDQVNWNYKRTWRGGQWQLDDTIGIDYDYWNEVVDDIMTRWHKVSKIVATQYYDYIADSYARKGGGPEFYSSFEIASSMLGVWENEKKVTPKAQLHGPQVDVGPTLDFALFLEDWERGSLPNLNRIYQTVGALHAIWQDVAIRWSGIHKISMIAIKPGKVAATPTPGRTEPIELFPIIRILPRHYGRR